MLADRFVNFLERCGTPRASAINILSHGAATGKSIEDVVPAWQVGPLCTSLGVGPHTTLNSLFDEGQWYGGNGMGQTGIQQQVISSAEQYGIPPSIALALAQTESSFNPNAVSPKGAVGVMQLMPKTATSLGVTDPTDPTQNIDAGMRYLASLISQYGGNINTALAAYNAGPGTVAAGTIPTSTYNYVSNINNLASTTYAGYDSTKASVPAPVPTDSGSAPTDPLGLDLSSGLLSSLTGSDGGGGAGGGAGLLFGGLVGLIVLYAIVS